MSAHARVLLCFGVRFFNHHLVHDSHHCQSSLKRQLYSQLTRRLSVWSSINQELNKTETTIPDWIPDYDNLPPPPAYISAMDDEEVQAQEEEDDNGNDNGHQQPLLTREGIQYTTIASNVNPSNMNLMQIENENENEKNALLSMSDEHALTDSTTDATLKLDQLSNTRLPSTMIANMPAQSRFNAISFANANEIAIHQSLKMEHNSLLVIDEDAHSIMNQQKNKNNQAMVYANMAQPPWIMDPDFIEPRREEQHMIQFTQYQELFVSPTTSTAMTTAMATSTGSLLPISMTHEQKVMEKNLQMKRLDALAKQEEIMKKGKDERKIESLSVSNDENLRFRIKLVLVVVVAYLCWKLRLNSGYFMGDEYHYLNEGDAERNKRLADLNIKLYK